MVTRTATRNGNAPKFGVPTGKFLELSQKTHKVGPYEITDQLSVPKPTKKRNEAMRDAERRQVIGQAQLNIAYNLSNVPAPPMPEPPKAPLVSVGVEDSPEEAEARMAAATAEAAEKYGHALEGWKREIGQWRANLEQAQKQVSEISESVLAAENDWDQAFLGPQHDEIIEFFDELDEQLWLDFRNDLRKHWVPSQPADDLDLEDEDEAGKALKSSTG